MIVFYVEEAKASADDIVDHTLSQNQLGKLRSQTVGVCVFAM